MYKTSLGFSLYYAVSTELKQWSITDVPDNMCANADNNQQAWTAITLTEPNPTLSVY